MKYRIEKMDSGAQPTTRKNVIPWQELFQQLKPNTSLFLKCEGKHGISGMRARAHQSAAWHGYKIRTRKEDGGIRVWVVKGNDGAVSN